MKALDYINIGNVKIEKTACLAPMASVADASYRQLCKSYGASYLVSEMISSKGLCYGDKKTDRLCTITDAEYPAALQLFGEEPEFMGRAAYLLNKFKPSVIDINMGCPVPKIVGNGSGSALMREPEKAFEIARAVVKNAECPVTAKIRAGWSEDSVNAVEFAKGLEQAGVSAITVHPRTRNQYYSGKSDWSVIKKVKEAVGCIVIGNGDVKTAKDCEAMYEQTGCDLVMIGRASYGRPWVFEQVKHYFLTGEVLEEPLLAQRMKVMLRHAKMLCDDKGEAQGMREARKNVIWYVKGLPGSAEIRNACACLNEYSQLEETAEKILRSCSDVR